MRWIGLALLVLGLGIIGCGGESKTNSSKTSDIKTQQTETVVRDTGKEKTIATDANSTDIDYASLGMQIEANAPQGLAIGDDAPVIKMQDYNGNMIDSEKILELVPMVVMFYRGKWCPLCSKYLSEFNDSLKYIQDEGAIVLTVTPETADNAREMRDITKMSMNIIPDSANVLMNAFDVAFDVTDTYQEKIKNKFNIDIAENNGAETAQLPVPATFIINKSGQIAWKHFDPDYKNRASVKQILDHLWD